MSNYPEGTAARVVEVAIAEVGTIASGGTTNSVCQLLTNNSTSGYLGLSAEL